MEQIDGGYSASVNISMTVARERRRGRGRDRKTWKKNLVAEIEMKELIKCTLILWCVETVSAGTVKQFDIGLMKTTL